MLAAKKEMEDAGFEMYSTFSPLSDTYRQVHYWWRNAKASYNSDQNMLTRFFTCGRERRCTYRNGGLPYW